MGMREPRMRDYSRSVDPPSAYDTEDGRSEYEAACDAYDEYQQYLEDKHQEEKE